MINRKISSSDINYFKIGSFVMIGIALAISAILIFGSGKLFQKTVYIETYFDESVQGLSIGSPVKYRGVQIGYVKDISFVNKVYNDHFSFNTQQRSRYIYVRLAITSSFITERPYKELKKTLHEDIASGLRIRLALVGLTGNNCIELNFVDPKENSPLVIDWTPKYLYIPSTPKTLTQFSDNVQYVLNELKKVDFKKITDNIESLTHSSKNVAKETHDLLLKTNHTIVKTVHNLENISDNLRILTEQTKDYPSLLLFGKSPPKLEPNHL